MTILQRKRPNAWDCINVWQAFFCRSCLFQRRTHTPQSDDDETEFARQCQKVQLLVCGRGKNLIISCEFDHPWFSSETKFFGPFWTVNACAKHCGLISWIHDMDMAAWHTWTNNMPTVACSRYIHVAGTLKQRGFGISWSHDSRGAWCHCSATTSIYCATGCCSKKIAANRSLLRTCRSTSVSMLSLFSFACWERFASFWLNFGKCPRVLLWRQSVFGVWHLSQGIECT